MDLGFETIGNATLIFHDNRPLLVTDPWIQGPAYFGSWTFSHEIPAEQMEHVKRCEFVWISHGHPAHLNGESIEMYVGFRGKQQGDKSLLSPKLNFPYEWNFLWIEPALVATANAPVNAHYWYQTGEETFAGEVEKRLNLIHHALFHSRSDAAIVRLATRVSDTERIDQAKGRLAKLAAELFPQLLPVLPK